MIEGLLLLAALVGGGVLLSRGDWKLLDVSKRPGYDRRAEDLWKSAIVDLLAKSPDPQSPQQELPVTVVVVGLRGENPNGTYAGQVQYAPGTTFKEGTFVEFLPRNVWRIQA